MCMCVMTIPSSAPMSAVTKQLDQGPRPQIKYETRLFGLDQIARASLARIGIGGRTAQRDSPCHGVSFHSTPR